MSQLIGLDFFCRCECVCSIWILFEHLIISRAGLVAQSTPQMRRLLAIIDDGNGLHKLCLVPDGMQRTKYFCLYQFCIPMSVASYHTNSSMHET